MAYTISSADSPTRFVPSQNYPLYTAQHPVENPLHRLTPARAGYIPNFDMSEFFRRQNISRTTDRISELVDSMLKNVDSTTTGEYPPQEIKIESFKITDVPYDGIWVKEIINKMTKIPLINVVKKRNGKYSARFQHDNNWLYFCKNAFIPIVQVICHPKDLKEDSNKRNNSSGRYKEVYEFNNTILKGKVTHLEMNESLPLTFSNIHDYGSSFLKLIIEEAWAVIAKGKAEEETNKNCSRVEFQDYSNATNDKNPSCVTFQFSNEALLKDVNIGDIFLLKRFNEDRKPIIGLVSYRSLSKVSLNLYAGKAKIKSKTYAKKLGSLLNLQRMYEACSRFKFYKNDNDFDPFFVSSVIEKSIISAKPPGENLSEEELLGEDLQLNIHQKEAVSKFLKLNEGIDVVQGPPGSGKTKTVLALMKCLNRQKQKIVVCAPSNKAVHELAERFLADKDNSDIPAMLVGVEGKLSKEGNLLSIFFDEWWNRKDEQLSQLYQSLSEFFSKHSSHWTEDSYQELESTFSQMNKNLDSLFLDFKKYNITLGEEQKPDKIPALIEECKNQALTQQPGNSVNNEFYSSLSSLSRKLNSIQMKISKMHKSKELEKKLLKNSSVLFMTLSIAGQSELYNLMKGNEVDVLIIDEAGQAVEAETLIPFWMNPKKILLAGDIKQLPAMVISEEAKKCKFDRSLMERLLECGYPSTLLGIQYRMHPEISQWPSKRYYNGQLDNDVSVTNNILKGVLPYAFIDVNGEEETGPRGHGLFNRQEVIAVALIVDYLATFIDVKKQVAIVSFYADQVNLIKYVLMDKYPQIKAKTVDGFQGGESDILIKSCVRSNFKGEIGFLEDERRLNVALTRARCSLIILGNKKTLSTSKIANLIDDAEKRNIIFPEESLIHSNGDLKKYYSNKLEEFAITSALNPQPHFQKNFRTNYSNRGQFQNQARGRISTNQSSRYQKNPTSQSWKVKKIEESSTQTRAIGENL